MYVPKNPKITIDGFKGDKSYQFYILGKIFFITNLNLKVSTYRS